MKNLTRESGKLSKFDIEKRWSKDLVKDGWMPVSNYFLENYHKLKPYDITHSEAMFIIHVMQFKWDENAPHPGYKTIAKRMGISDKSARRYAQSLEQKGYLNRKKRVGQTNRFDFEPLIKALIDLKKEKDK